MFGNLYGLRDGILMLLVLRGNRAACHVLEDLVTKLAGCWVELSRVSNHIMSTTARLARLPHGNLLSKGEVLQRQLPVRANT